MAEDRLGEPDPRLTCPSTLEATAERGKERDHADDGERPHDGIAPQYERRDHTRRYERNSEIRAEFRRPAPAANAGLRGPGGRAATAHGRGEKLVRGREER